MKSTTLIHQPTTGERAPTQKSNDAFGKFFSRRVFPGFKIGEALLWFCFVVMWPILLGGIYFLGGVFQSGQAMPVNQFIVTSFVVALTKAIVTIPFWWLFFVRLSRLSISKRILFHPLAGCIYAGICIFIIYQIKVHFLIEMAPSNSIVIRGGKPPALPPDPYPKTVMLMDFYNLLTAYAMNFVVFHAYNFWLSTQRQKQKEQEIRELAFQSEINALKTQIEPHFLFNTLNSISASVPPDQEKTRMLIADLADTFRFALKASDTEKIPLEEELQFIKTWLALEQHRLKEKLQISYSIDSRCLGVQVPPMLLQPIVENALNHGIAPKIGGGAVHIECLQEDGLTKISVSDKGVGYEGNLQELLDKGIGLKNTSRRLQLLYSQTLHIERNGEGLTVWFYIPAGGKEESSTARQAKSEGIFLTTKPAYPIQ